MPRTIPSRCSKPFILSNAHGRYAPSPPLRERIVLWTRQKDANPLLTCRQKDILADLLSQLRDNFIELDGVTAEELGKKKWAKDAIKEYEATMMEAIRNGLADHQPVKEWIETRQALGQWDDLRTVRRGIEKGVRRPLASARKNSPMNSELWGHIMKLAPTMSREAVRRKLIEEGKLPKNYSKQAFHKLLTTHNLGIFFQKHKSR